MDQGNPVEKQNFWPHHIEAQRRSGISQAKYCELHGIKTHNFGYHLKRYREDSVKKPIATDDFIRVGAALPSKNVTIRLSNGISIEIPSNSTHLIEIVKSLREIRRRIL